MSERALSSAASTTARTRAAARRRARARSIRGRGPRSTERASTTLSEIDDFEILAEADADDADLLASHGEADVSGSRSPLRPERGPRPAVRPSLSDFASRLDLGDESEVAAAPEPEPGVYVRDATQRRAPSHRDRSARAEAGHALAAFEDEHSAFDGRRNPALDPSR